MKILKLKIEYSDKDNRIQKRLFDQFSKFQEYCFYEKTLITSLNENSKGKTTLVRFILFALGYKISLTDGMNTYNYRTILTIENDKNIYELVHDGDNQFINGILFSGKILNQNIEERIPMVNHILGLNSEYIINSLLGCFYIDQEKGWTLLNRGIVIGKNKFNIEKFLIGIKEDKILEEINNENIELNNEIKKTSLLKLIKAHTIDYTKEIGIEINPYIHELEDFEYKKREIVDEIFFKKKELKRIKKIIDKNGSFVRNVEELNLVIEYDGKTIPITKENLKGYNFSNYVLEMKENELNIQILNLEKQREKLTKKIRGIKEKFSSQTTYSEIEDLFTKIGKIDIDEERIAQVILENRNKIKENKKNINNGLKENTGEFWKILKEVLEKIGISQEYIDEEIIFRKSLIGITGTQLHKLTFSFKIALTLYIKNKFNINLPFIIDSPRSGEINKETASKMLKVCNYFLKDHQFIVSSVYNSYDVDFLFEYIVLKNGVVNEIEKFIKK